MVTKPVLLKLGGSLITDKSKHETLNLKNIGRLAAEIHEAHTQEGFEIVVGHGGGSFPHRHAYEHQTQKGVSSAKSRRGIALVQDAAARLNRIVVTALLEAGENAISMQPSAWAMTKNSAICEGFIRPIESALKLGMVPVPYGDVAFDSAMGCSIISTEKILGFLAGRMGSKRIIIAANEDGVWADFPRNEIMISEINSENFNALKKHLKGSKDIDVTGGMLHKVERVLAIAKESGAEVLIINGSVPGRVKDALLGKKVIGTRIRA